MESKDAICLEAPGDIMDGSEVDILTGKYFDFEMLEYVPDILEDRKAQEMIKGLVDKFPEMEIRGRVPDQLADVVLPSKMEENARRIGKHR